MSTLPQNHLSLTNGDYLKLAFGPHLAREILSFQEMVKAKVVDIRKSMYGEV